MCVVQALKPHVFVSVPRLWNRIYDRVMATMREANPVKRRLFEHAFAYKRAALEAGEQMGSKTACLYWQVASFSGCQPVYGVLREQIEQ